MLKTQPTILSASRAVLRTLIVLNIVFCVVFVAALAASFWVEGLLLERLARRDGLASAQNNLFVMRAVVLIALVVVPFAHLLLTRLLAVVETVRSGDPFVALNAHRLKVIAWSLLAIQLLDLAFGAVALSVIGDDAPLSGWTFNITGWLAVLLLFVLARVFQHGARMRDDMEGTV